MILIMNDVFDGIEENECNNPSDEYFPIIICKEHDEVFLL
jgi:hypothetical protein